MTIEEANSRLKNVQLTTKQFLQIGALYVVRNMGDDDFCKIIDTVGIDKLIEKKRYYEWLSRAKNDLMAKERYLTAKQKLEELEIEKKRLNEIVSDYERAVEYTINARKPKASTIHYTNQERK